MKFQQSVKICLWVKYAEFSGRASRSEYWWFTLFTFLVGFVFGFLDAALGFETEPLGPLGATFTILVLLPGLAVSVRRLHDRNLSGHWVWVWLLLIFLTAVLVPVIGRSESKILVGLLAVVFIAEIILPYIIFMFPSQHHTNRFGAPPAPISGITSSMSAAYAPTQVVSSGPSLGSAWGVSGYDVSGVTVRLSLDASSSVEEIIVIGRNGNECDWVLTDPSVSRKHAEIVSNSSGIFIRDLGSANGTFINGAAVKAGNLTQLPNSGTLLIGSVELVIFRG